MDAVSRDHLSRAREHRRAERLLDALKEYKAYLRQAKRSSQSLERLVCNTRSAGLGGSLIVPHPQEALRGSAWCCKELGMPDKVPSSHRLGLLTDGACGRDRICWRRHTHSLARSTARAVNPFQKWLMQSSLLCALSLHALSPLTSSPTLTLLITSPP
jgi:hypothetical protein